MREKSQVSYYIEYCGRIKPSENGKQKNFYFTTFKDVKLPNMLYCSLQISLVANVLTYFGKEEGKVYFISSTAMP